MKASPKTISENALSFFFRVGGAQCLWFREDRIVEIALIESALNDASGKGTNGLKRGKRIEAGNNILVSLIEITLLFFLELNQSFVVVVNPFLLEP